VPLIATFLSSNLCEGRAHLFSNSLLGGPIPLNAIRLTLVQEAALTVNQNPSGISRQCVRGQVTRLSFPVVKILMTLIGHSFASRARRGGLLYSVAVRNKRLDWASAL